MIVSKTDESTHYPVLRDGSLEDTVKKYFPDAEIGDLAEVAIKGENGQTIPFSYRVIEEEITDETAQVISVRILI